MTGNCQFCGTNRRRLHRDHIVPKALGGADDPTNWQYLCANCHEDKTYAERQTPEWKAFASACQRGRRWNNDQRAAQSARQLGKKRGPHGKHWKLTPEQRAAAKASWTQDKREAARQRMLGKKFGKRDPSVGQKISAKNKGRKWSAESRARLSASTKGKPRGPFSESHLAALKAAAERRWRGDAGRFIEMEELR